MTLLMCEGIDAICKHRKSEHNVTILTWQSQNTSPDILVQLVIISYDLRFTLMELKDILQERNTLKVSNVKWFWELDTRGTKTEFQNKKSSSHALGQKDLLTALA